MDPVRPVLTVSEAARLLGISTSRVHQLLNSSAAPLDGPPRPGRGRKRVRQVYEDTLSLQRPLLRGSRARTSNDSEQQWAIRQLNAVNEALHEAAAKEAAAFRLYREALERMTEAFELHVQANLDVRRADALRSEILGTVLGPDDPSEL